MAARPEPPDADALDEIDVTIVPMRRRHIRSVLRIETQVYPRPWTLSLFLSELNLRATRSYVVARIDGQVVGYGGIMLSLDDAHVTTIAVDPAWQGHQLGQRLMSVLTREAISRKAKNLTLEVRVGNLVAQGLYQKFGLGPAGIRKGYYVESGEDAMVMWVHDIDAPEYLDRLERLDSEIRGRTIVELE
jgi:ribosomal-protein-alanine N-acetyltransferase